MFEVLMDDCLFSEDSSQLVSVIHHEGLTSSTLTRLDQLVTKNLCGSGFSKVLVVLKSLQILSANKDDLQVLINLGLTAKVMLWFKVVRDLLISDLHRSSPLLLNVVEECYDFFLLLGQASLPVSQLSVVLLHLAQVALEEKIHFPLRLEAIRTFNSILESLSRDQRRIIQNDQTHNQILSQMAAAVLSAGDYELQVSLSEALCRLTPRKEREMKANHWFSSCNISNAFCEIRDRDFEVKDCSPFCLLSAHLSHQDCRRFLNFINRCCGERRRVYTFPCLTAFVDSTQLFRPKDDKLDEFWIDFNLGSGCVSFFIDEPQGFLWGSIHLLREEVDHYTLRGNDDGCTGAEVVLSVLLNNPIMHHNSKGQTVKLSFSLEHQKELEEAAERVFMRVKSSPCVMDPGSMVMTPPSSDRHGVRSYSRKKQQSKSQLKILPLSSPSSEEESSGLQAARTSKAEFLFDQIQHSTPSQCSGIPKKAGQQLSREHTEFGENNLPFTLDISSSTRKRPIQDSGYLSDQIEGSAVHKRRVEPQPEQGESSSVQTEHLAVGAGLATVEELLTEELEPHSELTSGITAAFKNFKEQLEQHLAGSWKKAEADVLLSLKESQQHVTSLLTAVHQQRLLLLQRFEKSITDQLKQLEENSTNLNSINSQILSFFQSQMKQLVSFCDEHRQRLRTLENGELENSSRQ